MTQLKAIIHYDTSVLERDLEAFLSEGWRIISIYFAQGVHIAWIERHEHD